jgi:hypothetical protein
MPLLTTYAHYRNAYAPPSRRARREKSLQDGDLANESEEKSDAGRAIREAKTSYSRELKFELKVIC